MAGEAPNPPMVFLTPYKPPTSTLSKHLNKPQACACHSAQIFYIFSYNCHSRISAPTDLSSISTGQEKAIVHSSTCLSQQGLGIWQFLFFTMIAMSHCSNSNLVVTACKRKLPQHSYLPPAKYRWIEVLCQRIS